MFQQIVLRDLTKPVRARHHEHCGPYLWTPAAPGRGRGFYQSSRGLYCGDSTFRLRLEYANDVLPNYSRITHITGYFTDDFQGGMLSPIVARLPRSRGFLAGWTMGRGMCAELDAHIYDEPEAAAYAAHSMAEHDANDMRDDNEKYQREIDAEEALEALESGAP